MTSQVGFKWRQDPDMIITVDFDVMLQIKHTIEHVHFTLQKYVDGLSALILISKHTINTLDKNMCILHFKNM